MRGASSCDVTFEFEDFKEKLSLKIIFVALSLEQTKFVSFKSARKMWQKLLIIPFNFPNEALGEHNWQDSWDIILHSDFKRYHEHWIMNLKNDFKVGEPFKAKDFLPKEIFVFNVIYFLRSWKNLK